jgi:hypothetical protein
MVFSRLSTGDTFFVALQLIIRVHPEKRLNYTSDVLCFSGSALQNFLCTETLTAKLMCLFGFYFLSCFIQGSVLLHFLINSSDSTASAISVVSAQLFCVERLSGFSLALIVLLGSYKASAYLVCPKEHLN